MNNNEITFDDLLSSTTNKNYVVVAEPLAVEDKSTINLVGSLTQQSEIKVFDLIAFNKHEYPELVEKSHVLADIDSNSIELTSYITIKNDPRKFYLIKFINCMLFY